MHRKQSFLSVPQAKSNAGKFCAAGLFSAILILSVFVISAFAGTNEGKKSEDLKRLQEKFTWWPTDAKPEPVKDEKGGYWWWPTTPGEASPWGNRGYIYVYKIIFDYKEEELPPPQAQEKRPSLLIKKIVKNVKIYFDFDSASLRSDARGILESAVRTLNKNPETNILITGNCDTRGSENYNLKLGRNRADVVKNFMIENGIPEERIKIVSRGKLDAVAPVTDLPGMQKDRNAQFMIAEVEEVMIPYNGEGVPAAATQLEEGKYVEEIEEPVESEVKVSTREYTIKKGDTLWKIAERELGKGHRWKYIYDLNKNVIKNPNKLKAGRKILIPVE
ncbi:MAG: OmpA family protein [Candidatus Omnitrophica bacterium]|nr:OmpA family protein [Candidatus Omnitrophota bacterium]